MGNLNGVKFALKADNGLFVSRVDRGSTNSIEACKSTIDGFCQFVLEFIGDDYVNICADTGLYWGRIDRGSSNTIDAVKQSGDPFAIFTLESLGSDMMALRADTGGYLGRVNRGAQNPIEVQSAVMGPQSKFLVIPLNKTP